MSVSLSGDLFFTQPEEAEEEVNTDVFPTNISLKHCAQDDAFLESVLTLLAKILSVFSCDGS